MPGIAHVRGCRPDTMVSFGRELLAKNSDFADQVGRMERAVDGVASGWQGDAAAAASARALSEKLAGTHIDTAVVALAEQYSSFGARLGDIRTALLAIVDLEAAAAGMSVTDDGSVTAPTMPGSDVSILAAMTQQQLNDQAAGLESRIKQQLADFAAAENEAARAIQDARTDLTDLESSPEGTISGPVQRILDGNAELPTDPQQLHDLWETLSPAEKDALYEHDQYIGNRDGLPAIDRDHYNQMKLDDELARAAHGGDKAGKLDDLNAIKQTLDEDSNRMLLVLDTESGAQTHAAVAVGNPDESDHVSVAAPGLNTTVGGSLDSMVGEASRLKDEAELRLDKDGRASESVASVAWIGYDAPQLSGDLDDKAAGALQVATEGNAKAGAPALSSFYKGLDVSNAEDPHLTALGHSYGSVVTGMALQQTEPGVVDDMVVYGSPGLDTGHSPFNDAVGKLNVEPGHAYVMTAHDDPVAHLNRFGLSPGYIPGFTNLETESITLPGGDVREGATGHSEYPRLGDNGQLRTTGYNTAMIVGGMPDKAVVGSAGPATGFLDLVKGLAPA
ncbi:alpha/beta hydrolase [Rhodococcus sp. HNM0569]|uniref:alpha/beta hydrolase n=1 Tax=Rhodococcus sp. HNM0569 TaxID=2716340 RepID=UPI00146F1972|nr:alpha/beta hydrolase [Rhodococcus sp. HNM0569]NLU83030.1 hypothetical protein [Rhodococcus sp. HNM0569]